MEGRRIGRAIREDRDQALTEGRNIVALLRFVEEPAVKLFHLAVGPQAITLQAHVGISGFRFAQLIDDQAVQTRDDRRGDAPIYFGILEQGFVEFCGCRPFAGLFSGPTCDQQAGSTLGLLPRHPGFDRDKGFS